MLWVENNVPSTLLFKSFLFFLFLLSMMLIDPASILCFFFSLYDIKGKETIFIVFIYVWNVYRFLHKQSERERRKKIDYYLLVSKRNKWVTIYIRIYVGYKCIYGELLVPIDTYIFEWESISLIYSPIDWHNVTKDIGYLSAITDK